MVITKMPTKVQQKKHICKKNTKKVVYFNNNH